MRQENMGNSKSKKKKPTESQILTCGVPHSGKSTFFKQLKLANDIDINGDTFQILRNNILFGLTEMVNLADQSKMDPDRLKEFSSLTIGKQFTYENISCLQKIWIDPEIKRIWSRRHGTSQLMIENLDYCMEHISRFSNELSLPTERDILTARSRTTGQSQITIPLNKKQVVKFIDVGGQKSERRRWNQVVQHPTAIVFFASLADFNLFSYSSTKKTILNESIELWSEIVQEYSNTLFILALNKVDIFSEKIKMYDFKKYYPDFEGDPERTYETSKYIEQLFKDQVPEEKLGSLNIHITCILEKKYVDRLFQSFKDLYYRKMLSKSSLI